MEKKIQVNKKHFGQYFNMYIQLDLHTKTFKTVILGTRQLFFMNSFYWKYLQIISGNFFRNLLQNKHLLNIFSVLGAVLRQQRWTGESIFTIQDNHTSVSQNWECPKHVLASLVALLLPCNKESFCQCWIHGFNPWIRKIPWRRKWQPTPVFLTGKPHGQRSLAGYRSWGYKRIRHNLVSKQ